MKQFTIGLAGHIDHGKTSIVHSLTGKNTDNLQEEIKRGMTIDIGFAHMSKTISLIDVPGHEKFIKNMVAGVSSIDCAILVIAADDGIMPQTIEHFEILELLNIKNGVIVINKIDLVDNEWIDLVELEVKDFIKKSFLEKSTIIKTSTHTSEGIDLLKNEIIQLSEHTYNNDSGIFRMFLDRVFVKKGFGTVVTGTVSSGYAKVGDILEILPYSKDIKIRDLQSHDEKVNVISEGDRAAINIQLKDKLNIKRGDHISEKDFFKPSNLIIVKVNTLLKSKNKLKNNQRIRLHIGTQEVIGRFFLTGKSFNSYFAGVLKLEKKIICTFQDRFILRSFSPISTISGGVVLDSSVKGKWKKITLYANSLFDAKTNYDIIKGIIEFDDFNIYTVNFLSRKLGLSETILKDKLKNIKDLIYLESNKNIWLLTIEKYNRIKNVIENTLKSQHENNPDKKGFIKEEINSKINYDLNFLDLFLDRLCKDNIIKTEGDLFSLIDFSIQISNEEKDAIDHLINILNSEGLSTSSIDELCLKIKKNKKFIQKILKIEVSNNNIIFINNNIIITQKNYLKLLDDVYNFFKINDLMDVKQFKEISNTTRKYAVPLLEFLDKNKITYRFGNGRKINS